MIVDLNELSQTQRWGLQFMLKKINDGINLENQNITNYNNNLLEGGIPIDLIPLKTEQEYANEYIQSYCNLLYIDLVEYKKQVALQLFDSLSPEAQAQLVQSLGIPDIL